ncbi:hypothetical protein [Kordiimonas pumila]|uniref:Bacteriophage tail tape measure C-terminal domain-containing protein n=1 Tax=Kordiimonas pumila TaxID=2161677 RepID=A0ABV7D3R8_9PROT|nr:hypothetical protein [Kordiimonas pumila]
MTEEQTAASGEGGGAAAQAEPQSALAKLPGVLTDATGKIQPIIDMLQEVGLGAAAKPLEMLVDALNGGAANVQTVVDAVVENKENGVVGQALGGASAFLGAIAPEGDGGSFLEKVQEKVTALSEIWNTYYADLIDKDGKLNKEKAKNLALEVGDTILGAKKMAVVRKALAIGDAIRNTAVGVTSALKEPFPENITAVAYAVAKGAASLATIKGQAHDGLSKIPSTGTYLLEQGERVVGSRLNADLSSFLQAQQSSSSPAYDRSSHVTNSPSINLTINGEASGDAVYSNRNALEGMIRNIFADYAMEAPFA